MNASRPTSSRISIAAARDLFPALAAYQAGMLERGNAAVAVGKEALKRFAPAA